MLDALALFCFLAPPSSLEMTKRPGRSLQKCAGSKPPVSTTDCRRHTFDLFAQPPGIAPDDNNEVRPSAPRLSSYESIPAWRYPYFGSIVDTIERHLALDRSTMDPGQNATVYTLQDGFVMEDRSWIKYVRDERMTFKSSVLYRPQIVNKLVEQMESLFESKQRRGLMIKGPQGVGKSYSLINLTRYLLASGKYWVTIIPNCEYWMDETDFFRFLLQSVGVDAIPFLRKYNPSGEDDLEELISDIDTVLSKHGMQWVFIIDQINKIFARDYQQQNDVTALSHPFFIMKQILKPGRIISIISAAGSNDVSHRENHEGFDVFEHPIRLDMGEIKIMYPEAKWNWEKLEHSTGRVPWYLHRWLRDPEKSLIEFRDEIKWSLFKLRCEPSHVWDDYVDSAIDCLLHLPLTRAPYYFDRKFSQVRDDIKKDEYSVVALFPLVEEEYRKCFWNNLFSCIMKRDKYIRYVYGDSTRPANLRDHLFKEIVIARLVAHGGSPDVIKKILTSANVTVDEKWNTELGHNHRRAVQLPDSEYTKVSWYCSNETSFFIPTFPTFPAVDMMVRIWKITIAFQIHFSDSQNDIFTDFMSKVQEAGWNPENVEKIILVYLSPNEDTARTMETKIGKNTGKRAQPSDDDWVVTRFYSVRDFESLKYLQLNN